jgi:hypothetical protein
MDLALTATYFPHCGLTYAILFGCPVEVEEEILKRLSFATAEASHPLLMPGIFAELERTRHIHVVEATIDELESKIFELDYQSKDLEHTPASETEKRNQEKRSAWLDTTYLRNGLVSWRTQLAKVVDNEELLKNTIFQAGPDRDSSWRRESPNERITDFDSARSAYEPLGEEDGTRTQPPRLSTMVRDSSHSSKGRDDFMLLRPNRTRTGKAPGRRFQSDTDESFSDPEYAKQQMRKFGHKIKDRIQAIIDEYDDKIRDCTMRVDGMAMATQWVWTRRTHMLTRNLLITTGLWRNKRRNRARDKQRFAVHEVDCLGDYDFSPRNILCSKCDDIWWASRQG